MAGVASGYLHSCGAGTAPQNAYGNPDKMPTGGAKTKKVEVDIETGEEKIEDWPFHAAMWLLKQTEDARQKYGKKFTAGKSHLGRAKTDKQEEIALAGKEIAGITAKLAGMPKSHKDRAETERQLVELRERIAELRGVKLEDDATAADEGAGGTSGVAAKARVSSGGGPAGLASALEPIIGKVEQIAGVLKETAEEADKRRAHEYKMAQLQSQTQIESARLQAEAFANAIKRRHQVCQAEVLARLVAAVAARQRQARPPAAPRQRAHQAGHAPLQPAPGRAAPRPRKPRSLAAAPRPRRG